MIEKLLPKNIDINKVTNKIISFERFKVKFFLYPI